MRGSHLPTSLIRAQGNKTGLTSKKVSRMRQNARQDFIQVQILGNDTRNFKEVIALANSKIR